MLAALGSPIPLAALARPVSIISRFAAFLRGALRATFFAVAMRFLPVPPVPVVPQGGRNEMGGALDHDEAQAAEAKQAPVPEIQAITSYDDGQGLHFVSG